MSGGVVGPMPSVYDLKPLFQRFLRPLVEACVRRGITPNHLTLAALLGSVAAGAVLLLAPGRPVLLLVLPAWLFVRMALNAMDGMAAREHNMQTPLGAVLNELGDVLSDLALYLPLARLAPGLTWPVAAFCLGALLTEFAGVLGQTLGARRQFAGPMGKSDRAFGVGALALVTALQPRLLGAWPVLFALATALALLTVAHRLRAALAEVGRGARP